MAYDFAHSIANIWDIPVTVVFCTVLGVVNNMKTLFNGNTVLSYLPVDQLVKVCVKNLWQKRVSLVRIDWWKSDIAAFLEHNPGSMTNRHPANRKTGSPFVSPGETYFCNKVNPGYFPLAATARKPQQLSMFLHISARVWVRRWSPHTSEQKGSMLKPR